MIDHETLRRWLIAEGLWQRRRKRGQHRPPKEHFGELVQLDGSYHAWYGPELPRNDESALSSSRTNRRYSACACPR